MPKKLNVEDMLQVLFDYIDNNNKPNCDKDLAHVLLDFVNRNNQFDDFVEYAEKHYEYTKEQLDNTIRLLDD